MSDFKRIDEWLKDVMPKEEIANNDYLLDLSDYLSQENLLELYPVSDPNVLPKPDVLLYKIKRIWVKLKK